VAAALHLRVDALGDARAHRLHRPREVLGAVGLDHGVDVVALHAEVDEAEALALAHLLEGVAHLAPQGLAAQAPEALADAQQEVERVSDVDRLAAVVGDAIAARAAGAGAPAAAAGGRERELDGSLHGKSVPEGSDIGPATRPSARPETETETGLGR